MTCPATGHTVTGGRQQSVGRGRDPQPCWHPRCPPALRRLQPPLLVASVVVLAASTLYFEYCGGLQQQRWLRRPFQTQSLELKRIRFLNLYFVVQQGRSSTMYIVHGADLLQRGEMFVANCGPSSPSVGSFGLQEEHLRHRPGEGEHVPMHRLRDSVRVQRHRPRRVRHAP